MTTIVPEQRTAVGCHRRGLEVILASAPAAAATVVGCAVPPATSGPALHVHGSSDETFLVLAGVLLVHADGQVVTIPEGGLVRVSHGVPHTFATTPGSPACFLLLHAPGESGDFPTAAHAMQGNAGRLREEIIGDPECGWPHVGPVPAAGGILVGPVTACRSGPGGGANPRRRPGSVGSCQEAWRPLTAGWRLASGNDSRRSATEMPMGPFVRKGDESERKPARERA